jgi:hypothetical protein
VSSARRRRCTPADLPTAAAAAPHESGEALVAERVEIETETLQRGQSPQGRREGQGPPAPRVLP